MNIEKLALEAALGIVFSEEVTVKEWEEWDNFNDGIPWVLWVHFEGYENGGQENYAPLIELVEDLQSHFISFYDKQQGG